jgi:hypothetical protein
VGHLDSEFDFDYPAIALSAQAKASLGPEVKMKINKVAGPTVEAEGYLKAEGGIPLAAPSNATPWWKLCAGFSAEIGGEVSILKWTLADVSYKVLEKEWELASSKGGLLPIDNEPPAIPDNLVSRQSSSKIISLQWDESEDNVSVTGYKVYRDEVEITSTSVPYYLDRDITFGSQYCYHVTALDAEKNESLKSTEACITVEEPIDESTSQGPTLTSVVASGPSQINIAWEVSNGQIGAGYIVYRDGKAIKQTEDTSFANYYLQPSTQYCYEVSYFDVYGNESAKSSELCTLTPNSENGEENIIFKEDFTVDPNWTVTDDSYLIWNSGGFLQARVFDNGSPYWAYSPIFTTLNGSQSFTFVVDIKPSDPDWGTYPGIRFIKSGASDPYRENVWQISHIWADNYYKLFFLTWSNGTSNGRDLSGTTNDTKWYRINVHYNSGTSIMSWTIEDRETGNIFHEGQISSVDLNEFNQIAIGYEDSPDYGSSVGAEILVDNIKLYY